MQRCSRDELPSGRVPHTVRYRVAYPKYPLIDGLGHVLRNVVRYLASCVIVSGFRAALDLDIYPLDLDTYTNVHGALNRLNLVKVSRAHYA